ncbi:putative disease resistance protein RGA4 isoform X1 [Triticum dicoccoides]|uniref:putative disease resistance protein RGA4 isoform X1 n=1 Tax=Triticum dicoccoides TaxID=85692 RepID=UPI00188EC6CE|nr:putative disease resistance protein RGA4 isoform X1 [Triticum dicoccoides]XP_037472906.1 putative disease resistance protein RGA4 isoform X1 [Triticum dicoccoides]
MAMVLDAFGSYLGDLLRQVAEEELGMLLGVSSGIDKMGYKLRDLKNFLADADRRNITDETVQEWVGQLKRAMYEATDILDLCQLKAMERVSSSVDAGCFNPLLFCMRNPFHAHEIGTRIKALNHRLDTIKERSAAFDFINLWSYEDHSIKVHASLHGNPSRETSGELDRSGLVGEKIEEDTRALVAQIFQTTKEVNNNIMVFAIVGVGGIGKTTLAQKVFNDEAIQSEFSKKIWLSVNQNFSESELLRRAIIEAGGDHHPTGDAKATLQRTLKDALIDHKTLLVMDDVWNHGTWEGVLKIPLVNAVASGSRVLITTRDEGVARGMTATRPYHHIDTLAPDDAWSLLKKQVLSSEIDEDHINKLKDVGLKIIQKCGGLPLAIKVMGGLLRRRGELRHDWEHVLDDSKWSITGMPQELNYALYLSYEDMPSYLKQCFLYYSLLPKSRKFHVDQVIAMWISEGFIHGSSNDLEEYGRNYYNELISRNLIEPDKSYVGQSYCSMHDVVRSFAQYMTKDEALIAHNGDTDILTKLHSQKFLRLSIETDRLQSGQLDWKSLQEQKSARTLISTIQIKMRPGDSLVTFSSLRTLHIVSANVVSLVESLHQLKHLRYLKLVTDIFVLPVNIGNMKLLQFLDLRGCENLANLPDSIVKLGQLRFLGLADVCMIPRGFRGLTSMRRLLGFQAHMDGDWCSLDELGPLSRLRIIELIQLENVSLASFAANARLGEKMHLTNLFLSCTSRLGDDGLVKEKEGVSAEEQKRIQKVFDELCPPPSIENLRIPGYFGQQLPSWMMSRSRVPLNNLKFLSFYDLACCTQLPSGLCQLPCLQLLQVDRAPCIRRVGTGFLQAESTPFPRLTEMSLEGMVEWEEWEWEEHVEAMPRLEKLWLINCKLRRAPPGLASNAHALKELFVEDVQHLNCLEGFSSVVELTVCGSPDLERITNLPNMQKLTITDCPKLKVLESIPVLERLVLEDYVMEELPEYMRYIKLRHLQLLCRIWLLSSIAAGQSGLEWDKFSHVEHVQAYTPDGDNQRKWYVLYTRGDNFKLDSNISSSMIFSDRLSSFMVDTEGFVAVYKMRRSTFSHVCSLVRIPVFEYMMPWDHTFIDGRVLSLQDGVAIALRMLNSGESPVTVGSSLGVNESTVLMVTRIFVEALWERAYHQFNYPGSAKMEKIKRKFGKIHGLQNCCGVVRTAHITFGSQNCDHEENDGLLMQAVVDPDMRFTNIWLGLPGSMNQSSLLHDSGLFMSCEEGTWLNGSKLNLSDGWQVGEYIIGDAGYPLLPWLLTPYHLEDKDSSADFPPYQAEFNRRHSAATDVMLAALTRLKDTWKVLDREMWRSASSCRLPQIIYACCILHNIVIDLEEEAADMHSNQENYTEQVRQVAEEDAARVRDILSQHLIESGVHTMAAERKQEIVAVASCSGNKNKETRSTLTTDIRSRKGESARYS